MRLAVVTTHPIQYYAPWFRFLAGPAGLGLRVFYLWDFGVTRQQDRGFAQGVQWDVPLLEGYPWEFVPNRSRRPGTHHFWGLDNPDLPRRLRAYAPHAVLVMGYRYASVARLLLRGEFRGCPFLFRGDSHRLLPRSGVREWFRKQVISAVFRCFQAFLYVGSANRDYFCFHGVPSRKLFFSPHAVDNDRFTGSRAEAFRDAAAWKEELGIPAPHRVILFAGKLEAKKRPQDLLEAFARAALPDTSLLLVGSGALEQRLREQAAGVRHVYFSPFQNQSLMPRVYAAADLVVLPSFGDQETWGLCINEAMCLSRPVVVSSHVGCARDLVVPGRNGLVYEAGNVGALTATLRDALGNPERLWRWGDASLELVQRYSYQKATEGLCQALDCLKVAPRNPRENRTENILPLTPCGGPQNREAAPDRAPPVLDLGGPLLRDRQV